MNNNPVIIDGTRTPFAKNFTSYKNMDSINISIQLIQSLINKINIKADEIDQLTYGQVIQNIQAPNIAREIIIGSGLNVNMDAFSISRACTTSFQTAFCSINAIISGEIRTALAGGVDSCSNIPMQLSNKLSQILAEINQKKSLYQKIQHLMQIRKNHLSLTIPGIKEYFTRASMGETAEIMAKINKISREEQDAFAHRSHQLAAKARKNGELDKHIAAIYEEQSKTFIKNDNQIREESNIENYKKLKPVFDKKYGSVTAGNSCGLTDGAAAIFLASEEYAKEKNIKPLAYIKSYANAGIEVKEEMLMGPAYAIPKALDKAKLKLQDIDLFEIHEAFAAQIIANIKALDCKKFNQEQLNRTENIGEIAMDKLNILGGSLAYGHPFAATGARLITQLCYSLKAKGGGLGIAAACGAGGLGSAIILEVRDE